MKWTFRVWDNETGQVCFAEKQAQIARTEEWAQGLVWCDIEGFAIQEDGTLVLTDECGNFRYCPELRFTVQMLDDD